MNRNRVVFFSNDDGACFDMLKQAQQVLDAFDSQRQYEHICDIIEFYHVKLYVDAGLYLEAWSNELRNTYRDKVRQMWTIVNRFISSIDNGNAGQYLTDVIDEDIRYVRAFWQLFEKTHTYKQIVPDTFSRLFEITVWKQDILQCKNIVEYFNTTLRNLLLKDKGSAELLLSYYEKTGSHRNPNIYFPKSLSIIDKENIIKDYIESDNPNPNYIQLIITSKDQNKFKLSDPTKLKAKRRLKEISTNLFKSGLCATSSLSYGVGFSETQTDPVVVSTDADQLIYTYSIPHIQQNLFPFAIFTNIRDLFHIIDNQSRIALVRKQKDVGFEDIFGLHPQSEYLCTRTFQIKNNLAQCQLALYKDVLFRYFNINLETVVAAVFNTICSTSKIDNLHIQITPKEDCLASIRCLYPEIDSVLKKYKLYVEDGIIDFELLEMSSSPVGLEDIPSLVSKKYVYKDSEQLDKVMFYLYLDQSMLFLADGYPGKGYRSLFDLISKEDISFDSLCEYQKPKYEELISCGYLKIEDGVIRFSNPAKVRVLKDLYDNNVLSYWHLPTEIQAEVDELHRSGAVKFESKLFTTAEVEYLKYYLNKSYCNGLDLRNKYAHGSHGLDKGAIEADYNTLLLVAIMIIWKIVDDIMLRKEASK